MMRLALISALMLGACVTPITAEEPTIPLTETADLTPNAKWLIGEFERRYQAEAALNEEIGRLYARDQFVRNLIIDMFNREQMTALDREQFIAGTSDIFTRVDDENTAALKAILAEHDMDDIAMFNPDLLMKIFHIVQHSNDEAFQAEMLPEFRQLAEAGKVDQQAYALLYDRVTLGQGGAQRYGTQYKCISGEWTTTPPVEEPAALDERRAELGMMPMSEYMEIAVQLYGDCPDE